MLDCEIVLQLKIRNLRGCTLVGATATTAAATGNEEHQHHVGRILHNGPPMLNSAFNRDYLCDRSVIFT
jgi:hypothetical protein